MAPNNDTKKSDNPDSSINVVQVQPTVQPQSTTSGNKNKLIIIIVTIVALYGSGVLGFVINTAACMQVPAIYSNFAAANSYTYLDKEPVAYLLGMPTTAIFWSQYDCSERSHQRREADEREAVRVDQIRKDSIYRPGVVNYPVYSPSFIPQGYKKEKLSVLTSEPKEILQEFVVSDKYDSIAFLIRQGSLDDVNDPSCNDATNCTKIGTTNKGQDVLVSLKMSSYTNYFILNPQNYITIQVSPGYSLSPSDVMKIFNSLQEVK